MDFATHEASELYFYATSTSEVYHRHLLPAYRLFERKWRAGDFDRLRAMQFLTAQALREAGRSYGRDHLSGPGEWQSVFPPDVRQEVASHLVDELVNELEIGNSYQ
jgi:hypothetical protein